MSIKSDVQVQLDVLKGQVETLVSTPQQSLDPKIKAQVRNLHKRLTAVEKQQLQLVEMVSTIMKHLRIGIPKASSSTSPQQKERVVRQTPPQSVSRCKICGKPLEGKAGVDLCAFGGTHPLCPICFSPNPEKHVLVDVLDKEGKRLFEQKEVTNKAGVVRIVSVPIKMECPNSNLISIPVPTVLEEGVVSE